MNNLFDNTEKVIKIRRNFSNNLRIKSVLNPFNQLFIDEKQAKELRIISNGYYRNCYGGLIPLHIAASQGYIQLIDYEQIEIEYRSKEYPIRSNLIIHQVYDPIGQSMISCEQATEKKYLDLELFTYTPSNVSMAIHEAFSRGLILGELRTTRTEMKSMICLKEKPDWEYDSLFSSLTNIINSLSEFRNTINLRNHCELTDDGCIRETTTGKCHLLTQAIDLGLVSVKDLSNATHLNRSEEQSTLVNETIASNMDISLNEDDTNRYFSETFISDLLKTNDDGHLSTMKHFLPVMNTC